MEGEFFVITINQEGVPQKMVGPETWDSCVSYLTATLKKDPDLAGTKIGQEDLDAIDMDGSYEYKDGGGIYIVQSERMTN